MLLNDDKSVAGYELLSGEVITGDLYMSAMPGARAPLAAACGLPACIVCSTAGCPFMLLPALAAAACAPPSLPHSPLHHHPSPTYSPGFIPQNNDGS